MDATPARNLVELFMEQAGNLSDKWEHYLAIYQRELTSLRESGRLVDLLEIGVQNGGSLQVWHRFLPPGSRVDGVDIDPACGALSLGPGVRVFVADATDPRALDTALGDATYDIVIDDGSHRSDHIIATFRACFERLRPGGLYVAEDLHCSYLRDFGGGYHRVGAAIEWFKALADAINVDHLPAAALDAPAEGEAPSATEMIRLGAELARVSFYDSMVVVERLAATKQRPYRRVIAGHEGPVVAPATMVAQLPPGDLAGLVLAPSAADGFAEPLVRSLAEAREALGRLGGQHAEIRAEAQAARAGLAAAERARATNEAEARQAAEGQRSVLARVNKLLAEAEAQRTAAGRRADTANRLAGEAATQAAQAASALAMIQEELRQLRDRAAQEIAGAAATARIALARADQAEHEIATLRGSTSWQLTRPIRTMGQYLPMTMRRHGRRALKLGWWTLSGQLRRRLPARSEPQRPAAAAAAEARVGREGADAAQGLGLAMTEPRLPAAAAADSAVTPGASTAGVGPEPAAYDDWCRAHEPDANQLLLQRRMAPTLPVQPHFSILVPVFRPPADVFAAMLRSVAVQTYPHWELCLAIVDSDAAAVLAIAEQAAAADARVRVQVLERNLGISGNSNLALAMATGDWVALLDHDDLLAPQALFQLARAVVANPEACFLYSDKDMIDRAGEHRYAPLLKPSWSPDVMLNANFLTHVCAMRTERIRALGGWDAQTDGAQDWDLFLRVIGGGAVVHVPQVLYHWRHIETSVSALGMEAKPYAAAGQLQALAKHLPQAGWPDALPRFDGPYLRVLWGVARPGTVSLVVLGAQPAGRFAGEDGALLAEVLVADGADLAASVDAAIERARGDTVVLVDAGFEPSDDRWLEELALPLLNPAVAAVAGRVFDAEGRILDFGGYAQDALVHPALRGELAHYSGPAGNAGWYRNAAVAAGGALAFRRALWKRLGGFAALAAQGRTDHAFTLAITGGGHGRILLNPFARFTAAQGPSAFERGAQPVSRKAVLDALPAGDPYLNPGLDAAVRSGAPMLRGPGRRRLPPAPHDYAAEARYVAATYDATGTDIDASVASVAAAPAGALRRVIWLLPDFQVPFYGGIYTILRAAEYMRTTRGVAPCFAVLTDRAAETIRASIAQAFPALAEAAEVIAFLSAMAPPPFGTADAAICTLWITAYPLLSLTDVRRKFYFLQDWEPTFYPGGTISTAVEATYRFGFHAICNTPALARSYAELGGRAEHFLPAVNPDVFHDRGRPVRGPDDPFVLVCYARPSTPRNCFESMSWGMRDLKRRYGARILIVSAGAGWEPHEHDLQGVVVNLGLLPYAETGALYRAADAGFVAMATRHPSYLPFELMACGAAVVTNRNPYTGWLLRDGENSLLCEMTRSDIAASVGRLIEEPTLRDRLAQQAGAMVRTDYADWTRTCERIYAIVAGVCEAPG